MLNWQTININVNDFIMWNNPWIVYKDNPVWVWFLDCFYSFLDLQRILKTPATKLPSFLKEVYDSCSLSPVHFSSAAAIILWVTT